MNEYQKILQSSFIDLFFLFELCFYFYFSFYFYFYFYFIFCLLNYNSIFYITSKLLTIMPDDDDGACEVKDFFTGLVGDPLFYYFISTNDDLFSKKLPFALY